ncbi:MAG: helicase, partial [Acidobacteria bacterium]|nr:helicase [Acidobacteriota bacterium]
VIEDILKSVQAQRAMEVAPRSTDPIQQTIATLLQNYLNHPDVNRREAIELIRTLNQPMFNVQLSALRKAYKAFQGHKDVKQLLSDLAELQAATPNANGTPDSSANLTSPNLTRDDLRLICFDVVSGG